MKILIVGCGVMGRWFADFFARSGHTLYFYDVDKISALRLSRKKYGVAISSLSRVPDIDGVLISTPIREAGKLIDSISGSLNAGKFIIEISSFKKPIWREVEKARQRGIICISIHPLFGPGMKDLKGTCTVHVEPSRPISERKILKKLLRGTRIFRMSLDEHDYAMGIAISLTHLVGLASGSALVKLGYNAPLTKSLSILLSLVAISYSEPISFYSEEVMYNEYSLQSCNVFLKEFRSFIEEHDTSRVINKVLNVREALGKRFKISSIYKELYSHTIN